MARKMKMKVPARKRGGCECRFEREEKVDASISHPRNLGCVEELNGEGVMRRVMAKVIKHTVEGTIHL